MQHKICSVSVDCLGQWSIRENKPLHLHRIKNMFFEGEPNKKENLLYAFEL